MEALASEMEKMVLGLEPHKDPSGSVNGANASGADAGDDAAREKEIRAAWEELFAKTMADISIEAAAGGGESDARGEPKDAFQQIRDENAERLRKSNAEQVVTGLHIVGETVRANSPSHRRVHHHHQMTTLPPCLARGMMTRCNWSLRP